MKKWRDQVGYEDNARSRFFDRTDRSGECWNWIGSVNGRGYGQMSYRGRCRTAHRVSWLMFRGEIPVGLVIDHLCRNTLCVRPDHLEAVSQSENIRRGVEFKFTPEAIVEIKASLGKPFELLMRKYNCNALTLASIVMKESA
jgi:hypothetical protein